MAPNRSVHLTKEQIHHERVLSSIVRRLQNTPYVLRGGTALALVYGLDRHSVDLDFDGDKKFSVKRHVRDGLRDVNLEMKSFRVFKDSDTKQGIKVHYGAFRSHESTLIKLDLSFESMVNPDDVVVLNGIRTYSVAALFDQKLEVTEDRTKAVDLFDLGFLAKTYGEELSTRQI